MHGITSSDAESVGQRALPNMGGNKAVEGGSWVRIAVADSGVPVERRSVGSPTMSGDTISGIPRVDPRARRGVWKRGMQWLAATKPVVAVHRSIAAPLDAPIMKATRGRVNLTGASPQPDEACRWSAVIGGLRSSGVRP